MLEKKEKENKNLLRVKFTMCSHLFSSSFFTEMEMDLVCT